MKNKLILGAAFLLASCITILPVCMKKEPCVISMIGIRANI